MHRNKPAMHNGIFWLHGSLTPELAVLHVILCITTELIVSNRKRWTITEKGSENE